MANILPTIENPEAEHARLDSEISARLKQLGQTNKEFDDFVMREFETTSKWRDCPVSTKLALVTILDSQINTATEETAA